jgi:hypothetical protein
VKIANGAQDEYGCPEFDKLWLLKNAPNARTNILMHVMAHKLRPDSIVDRESLSSSNTLDMPDHRRFRINRSEL